MIDDESKKFIKETIENTIDNKLSEHDKKTQASKRLDELKYEKRSLEDRKKLLAELDNKDKKGQATIAEKFEKLKLSVDTAIPQDFKDAWKTGSQGVQAGASQVGKGIGHLTQRAMMSNPLTAFLYQNRDILGAVGDIGIGTAKAGIGALKGLGHGALGLANSVKNLFHKGEDEEQVEELNLPKSGIFNNDSSNEKIVKDRNDWQKKIDVIHEIITRDLIKENKKSSEVLSKGLGGLNKTVEAVKGFTDAIASKQKLILGGILIGAAAIAGLVAWFKGGGLANLLNKQFKADEKDPSNIETQQETNQLNSLKSSSDWATKDNKSITNALKDYKDNKIQEVGKQTTINQADLQKSGRMDRALGAGEIDHGKWQGSGYDVDVTAMKNEKPIIFKLPFEVRLKKVVYNQDKGNEQYANVIIERRRKLGNKTVIITKVMQVLFPEGQMIPKNTPFLVVGENFDIIGDWKAFTNTEGGYVDYQKYWSYNDNALLNNFDKARTDDIKAKHEKQIKKDVKRQTYFKNLAQLNESNFSRGLADGIDKVEDYVTGKSPEKEKEEGTPTGGAAPVSISTNRAKAQEQKQKLNEKKEEPVIEQNTTQNKGYSGQLPTLTFNEKSKDTEYSHADLRPTSDITLMMSDTTTNTGAL